MIVPEKLYEKTLEIARKKLVHTGHAPMKFPRIGTGGHFTGIYLWDTAFCIMWAKYHPAEFGALNSLDNFYALQDADGHIGKEYSADGEKIWSENSPISYAAPLLGWAELELYQTGVTGADRLKKVFPLLQKQHEWNCLHFRRNDGLFFGTTLSSGMDDLPRWDDPADVIAEGGIPFERSSIALKGEKGDLFFQRVLNWKAYHHEWNRQLGWCDISCQMAFNARILAEIAGIIGETRQQKELQAFHNELSEIINQKCFDPKRGFYFDYCNGHLLSRRHVGAFWALISHVASEEQAWCLIRELKNPDRFALPCGVPSLSADDPDFDLEHGYWRGQVWPNAIYMVLRGLRDYGENKLAKEIAVRFYRAVANLYERTGTMWENYPPDQSEQKSPRSGEDFCGWSALGPISIWREFII